MIRYCIIAFILLSAVAFGQPANDNCAGAFTLPVNPGNVCVTTLSATSVGATQSVGNSGCGSADDDVWFSFISTSGNHTITVTPGTMSDVVFQVYTGTCAGLTSLGCIDNTAGASAETAGLTTVAGTLLFIRVHSYANSTGSRGTFSVCIRTTPDPPGTNCISGNQVCSNGSITGNSVGPGSEELTAANSGCLGSGGETNSHWFYINIGTTGNLEFTISPSNGSDDYDFAVWGPTNQCPPNSAPIRCNFAAYPRSFGCGTNTNPTGLSGFPGFTTSNDCQNRPYLDAIPVTAGQIYILLVNGFTPSASPYNLTFGTGASLSCAPIVVLPIDLINFNAVRNQNNVNVDWSTASEENSKSFIVERSVDGISFDFVKEVAAAGNSMSTLKYSIVDEKPYTGISYYRLKQTDINGVFKYSKIVTVEYTDDYLLNFEIVPNPNIDQVSSDVVFNKIPLKELSIAIFDINGVIVFEERKKMESNKYKVPDSLSNGIYFVRILNEDAVITKRMIVQ